MPPDLPAARLHDGRTLVSLLAGPFFPGHEPGKKGRTPDRKRLQTRDGMSVRFFEEARTGSDPALTSLKRNGRQTFGPPTPCNACLLSKANPYGSPR